METVTNCDTLPRLEGWRPSETFADLGCPVWVLNDADAALAEETHDLAPDTTAVIVIAGTWIGTAIRAHGEPLRGARGWAGEFGYAPIAVENSSVVRLDDLASGEAIARRLGTDGLVLYERATRGDPEALTAIREAGGALGLGLATLVNLLNPELLVLGGGAFETVRFTARPHWRMLNDTACRIPGEPAPYDLLVLGRKSYPWERFRVASGAPLD